MRKCFNQLCRKHNIKGNSRSFSNIANPKKFKVNLHNINLSKFIKYKTNKKIKVCSACLKKFKKHKIIYKNQPLILLKKSFGIIL